MSPKNVEVLLSFLSQGKQERNRQGNSFITSRSTVPLLTFSASFDKGCLSQLKHSQKYQHVDISICRFIVLAFSCCLQKKKLKHLKKQWSIEPDLEYQYFLRNFINVKISKNYFVYFIST